MLPWGWRSPFRGRWRSTSLHSSWRTGTWKHDVKNDARKAITHLLAFESLVLYLHKKILKQEKKISRNSFPSISFIILAEDKSKLKNRIKGWEMRQNREHMISDGATDLFRWRWHWGLGLLELALREGEEDEEKDLERGGEWERELMPEEERERPRVDFAIGQRSERRGRNPNPR